MKQSFKTGLLLWYKKRKDIDQSIQTQLNLTGNGLGISSVLIILPNSWNEIRLIEHFFKSLFDNNEHIRVKYCCQQQFASLLDERLRANLTTYSQVDCDRFGFPLEGFIKQIFIQKYDAIIDLNFDYNIFSSWLTRKSNATIKIGFNSDFADDFYNIILDKSETSLIEKGLKNIQKVLGI